MNLEEIRREAGELAKERGRPAGSAFFCLMAHAATLDEDAEEGCSMRSRLARSSIKYLVDLAVDVENGFIPIH